MLEDTEVKYAAWSNILYNSEKGAEKEKVEIETQVGGVENMLLRIAGNCLCGSVPRSKSLGKALSAPRRASFLLNNARVPETCPVYGGGLCCT